MRLLLKLAWRNIWRNKRRSILTLLAVAFATFATIAMRGLQLGTYDINIKNAVEIFTGYAQIQEKDYRDKRSLRNSFKLTDELKNNIEQVNEIQSYAPRVYSSGLASYNDNSLGAAIYGVNPAKEKETTGILGKINDGQFFTSANSDKVVLGYKLLKNLEAEIGDTIVVLAQGYDGSMGNLKFEITGTVKVGTESFDAMGVFMGIETAQQMLSLYGNRIQAVALSLNDLDNIKLVKSKLQLPGEDLEYLAWDEIMPEMKQSIQFDNISGILFLGILIVIVTFGILNTILMSVTERFREFGVSLSIGMQPGKLVLLVIFETLFIALIGLVIGNIIGYLINYYFILNPIVFSGDFAKIYEEYGFIPKMISSVELGIFIRTTLTILALSFIAIIYPAYKVYKLEPLKGIRYT